MWDFWPLDGHCQQGDSFSHGWIKGTTFCLVDRIFLKVLICAVNYHYPWLEYWTSPVAQMVKNLPAMQETQVQGREWQPTPVFLPGEFHGQEKPGGKSMGLQRVGHD